MLRSTTGRRRWAIAACALLATGLLVGVGFVVVVDHPFAELGVSGTGWSAFTTVDDRADAFEEQLIFRRTGTANVTVTTDAVQFANGTVIRRRAIDDPVGRGSALVLAEQVLVHGKGYRKERYRPGGLPGTARNRSRVLVRGNTTFERVPRSHVNRFGLGDRSILSEFTYARGETVERDGERLVRYDVVGERGGAPAILENEVGGYVLVSATDRTVRFAFIRSSSDDGSATIEYTGQREPSGGVPAWVSRVGPDLPVWWNESE